MCVQLLDYTGVWNILNKNHVQNAFTVINQTKEKKIRIK